MSKQYSFCRADMINPEILCSPGRDWYGSKETVLHACCAVQRALPGAYWLLSKDDVADPKVYGYLPDDGVALFLAIPKRPGMLTEESIEDEWDHLNAPLRELMARFQTTNKEDDMSESKSKYDNATMATQLRDWAFSLKFSLKCSGASDAVLLRGIIGDMRKLADDLAPKKLFARHVRFTRSWADDWELVRDRIRPGLGPLEAWTDQVRAEVEGALTGAMLAWESYSIEGESGDEKLTIVARLRFAYDPEDVGSSDPACAGVSDTDVLQELLYDQGGCVGDFTLIEEN